MTEWKSEAPAEVSCNLPKLKGARASGKTCALQKLVAASTGPAVVVIPWPWERPAWKAALKGRRDVVIHTPDSLARWALDRWEKTSGKTLVWTTDEERLGNDPEEQAAKLLTENRMSAGPAHWLLKEEISGFVKKHLFPGAKLLALDEPETWEPEAAEWIREIPCERRIETARSNRSTIWRPGNRPIARRWARCENSGAGAGEWVMESLKKRKTENWLLIVQTEKGRWHDYLQARGELVEIRHAAECEGRTWDRILIPSLRKQWGGAVLGRDWLDLAASCAKKECVIRIGPEGPPSWVPPTESGKPYLWWEP